MSDLHAWPVAILAGGLATRLRPLTEKIPKALVTVANEPFMAHQLRLLASQGFKKIVICAGYLGEMIEQEFEDGSAFDLEISYVYDGPTLLGTGGAIRKALPLLGKKFLVLYGDSFLPIQYGEAVTAFVHSRKTALMTVFRNHGNWDASNVHFADGEIICYDKKNLLPQMQHIDYGLGILESEVFAFEFLQNQAAFDLADLYHYLAANRLLAGYEVHQRFYEIGSHSGLEELDNLLRNRSVLT